MKIKLIFFAYIIQSIYIQTEQNSPYNQQPIQITINAQTQSGLEQDNDFDQKAKHTSIPTTIVDTKINSENNVSAPKSKNLEPDESMITFVARNSVKSAAIVGTAIYCQPLVIAYFINRLIIQPILKNGDISETVTEEEKQEYAKKGLWKVPDLRFFPIAHNIKERLTK